MTPTPSGLGYRMPAEWEKHEATWVSWPKNRETFPAEIITAVEKTYVRMIDALSEGEEVRVLVDDEETGLRVAPMLKSRRNVLFQTLKTADVWVRDYAPICVKGKGLALTKWVFNSWGGKYDDLKPDNEAGAAIARSTGLRVFEPGMVLEGGSVEVNGKGTLITTEQCLLNPNRNPGLGKEAIETVLKENLGVARLVWLKGGIAGDDTDGHVDDVARFVDPGTVLLAWERDGSDPNHRVLAEDLDALTRAVDQDGEKFDIVTVPMPGNIGSPEGRLPASHLNFYIGNSAVLVPTFESSSDRNAVGTIGAYFPDRDVVGIDCRALVYGFGSVHCVTQQVPSIA